MTDPNASNNLDLFGQPSKDAASSASARVGREAALVAAYIEACQGGKTLDDLPYTDEFERLCARIEPFFAANPALMAPRERRHEILRLLQNMRKASKLPTRKAVAEMEARPAAGLDAPPHAASGTMPIRVTEQEESLVRDLIAKHTGQEGRSGVGKRDRLPYSPEFDALRDEFVRTSGRDISDHDLWRLIAKLAK
ncbi:MAG: hypothetical protein AB7Q00_13775 [Phycisphaerales bacterium]